jgi:guanine deaminase
VQTHLAENPRECAEVKRRFGRPYLEVYERAGLVRDGAVFAHCIHLQRREVARLSRSVRVHCPTSNLFLGSGVMRWNGPGRLALGSDVGAGWTLSPFEVMRCSLAQGTGAAPADLLRAGCGRLAPGEPADAVILGAGVILPEGAPDVEGTADLIDRIVHRGGRAAVREVYVDGRAL